MKNEPPSGYGAGTPPVLPSILTCCWWSLVLLLQPSAGMGGIGGLEVFVEASVHQIQACRQRWNDDQVLNGNGLIFTLRFNKMRVLINFIQTGEQVRQNTSTTTSFFTHSRKGRKELTAKNRTGSSVRVRACAVGENMMTPEHHQQTHYHCSSLHSSTIMNGHSSILNHARHHEENHVLRAWRVVVGGVVGGTSNVVTVQPAEGGPHRDRHPERLIN